MRPNEKVNILLVDDKPENLLALEAILESLDQNLVKANSGPEALKYLLKQEFAVVLLDVQMPIMDGFETAKLIRTRPTSQYTPIIFITAINRDEKYIYKGYSLDAVDYLLKPIVPEILLAKVRTFISLFQAMEVVKQQSAQLKSANKKLEDEIAKREQAEIALSKANEELEIRVAKRTNELRDANEKLIAEIAQRQEIEIALRKSENQYRTLVETIPHGIEEIDTTGTIIFSNPAQHKILGYESGELLGKRIWELTPKIEASHLPEYLAMLVKDRPLPTPYVGQNLTKQGNLIDIQVDWNYKLDSQGKVTGFTSIITDITERNQAELALQESEERFRVALKNSPLTVFTQDTNLRYTWVYNTPPEYTVENVLGKNDYELCPPEDAEKLTTIKGQVMATGLGTRQEIPFKLIDKLHHFDLTIEPLFDPAQEIIGITCASMDITQQKEAEEMRLALGAEQELRKRQLRFFSMVSHEFRTPLATILGSAQILESCTKEWPESKRLRNLHRIKSGAKYLSQLLDDILTINRAETGKLEFNPRPIDLDQLCYQLVEAIELTADAKNSIKWQCHGQNQIVNLDEKLIRYILTNLLSNAVKYSPQGQDVNFNLTYKTEALVPPCPGDLIPPIPPLQGIVFQIQDKGIGIPPEDQNHLFDLFHRGANVGEIPGTGLGLSVVKKCVELQRGEIAFKSEVGIGTTVTVTIPVREVGPKRFDEAAD